MSSSYVPFGKSLARVSASVEKKSRDKRDDGGPSSGCISKDTGKPGERNVAVQRFAPLTSTEKWISAGPPSERSSRLTSATREMLGSIPTSAGQSFDAPSQCSAASQTPVASRHTVAADFFLSAGHAIELPVQLSATSQTPAAGRHCVPAGSKTDSQVTPTHSREPQSPWTLQLVGLQAAEAAKE